MQFKMSGRYVKGGSFYKKGGKFKIGYLLVHCEGHLLPSASADG